MLRENLTNAQNSEDVGTLQALEALDGLDAKLNQVQVAYQQFYTTIGIENVWKGFLDGTRSVIDTLNGLPKLFGIVPANAAAMAYTVISLIKTVVLNGFSSIASQVLERLKVNGQQLIQVSSDIGKQGGTAATTEYDKATKSLGSNLSKNLKNNVGQIVSSLGSIGVMLGAVINKSTEWKGALVGVGGAVQAIGGILQGVLTHNWVGAIFTIASGVLNVISGISIGFESSEEKLERLTKEAENLNNEAKKAKAEYNTLNRSIDKINELNAKRNDSIEATEEYHDAVNELADSFPQLIIGFDDAGNAIIDAREAEELLADMRRQSAKATMDAAMGEKAQLEQDIINANEQGRNLARGVHRNELVTEPQYDSNWYPVEAPTGPAYMPKELYNEMLDQYKNDPLAQFEIGYGTPQGFQNYLTNYLSSLDFLLEHSDELKRNINPPEKQSILDDLNILSDDFDLTNKETQDKILDLNKRILEYQKIEGDFLSELYNNDSEWLQLIEKTQEIRSKQNQLPNVDWRVVNSQLSYYNEDLEFNSLLRNIVTSGLIASGADLQNISTFTQLPQVYIDWWNGFGEDVEQINNIFNNLQNYSLQNIYDILNLDETQEDIYNAVGGYYTKVTKEVSSQIQARLQDAGINIESSAFESQLGLSVINELVNILLNYESNGLEDNFSNLSIATQNLLSALNIVANESVEDFVGLLNILNNSNLSTKEGIAEAQAKILAGDYGEAGDNIYNSLIVFSDNIITNYLASIQAAIDTNTTRYTADQKSISKLITGMDLSEVFEFIDSTINQALDNDTRLNFSDFQADAKGTFTVTNEKAREFWEDYFNKNYKISEEATSLYETLINESFDIDQLKFNDKLRASLGIASNATDEEIQERIDIFIKQYKLFSDQVDAIKDAMLAQLYFEQGDYTALFTDTFTYQDFAAEVSKGVNVKRDNLQLQAAVESASSAISDYLNEVIDKGFERVDNRLYALPTDIPEFIDYPSFIQAFSNWYDTTSEEWNSLVIAAIEKQSEQTIGVQDLIKNVSFISDDVAYASLDTIEALANIFNRNVAEMFDPNDFNELLGGYRITNFDLSQVENAQTMVADSIQQFFEDIANLISNGIAGKLSNQDRDNLIQQMQRYNIEVNEAMFTQTANGLKLSADAATALYSRLRDVDSLRAQLIFDDLADSLQESGEVCENISSTLAAIARLEADLQNPENQNNQLLKDRLALYKEIAQSQMSDPSQYSFMNRNLPSGMQGPENYWNAVGKAYDVMNDAKSTGYMEIQDYYNIINEMTNLMEMSGGQLEWMGMNFENSAEMSAKLIEQGMSALTNIDGNGVKISMEKLGQDFGIGVDDMSKGFDDGIKEMARAQIKMLDAQIALLEAVVAMEGLGEIDVDNVAGFSFGDVFNVDEKTGEYLGGFTEAYEQWAAEILKTAEGNADLANALDSLKFNGQALRDMLTIEATDAKMTEEEAKQYFAAMNSLYQMFLSGEYDLQDLIPSIMRVAATSHFEGEISVGDDKIYISHGIVLETNEEGQYVTAGGKTFDNVTDASDYLALMRAGVAENDIIESTNAAGEISYSGQLIVGKQTIELLPSENGLVYHSDRTNKDYDSLEALMEDEFVKDSNKDHNITLPEWKIEQGYTIVPKFNEVEQLSAEQINALLGKSAADLEAEWAAASASGQQVTFKATYGFEWINGTTEDELEELKAAQGIESKKVDLTLSVTSDNEEITNLLSEDPAQKDIVLNVTDINYGTILGTDPETGTPTLNLGNTSSGLQSLYDLVNDITSLNFDNFNTLNETLAPILEQVQSISEYVQQFANQTFTVELNQTSDFGTADETININTNISSFTGIVSDFNATIDQIVSSISTAINSFTSVEDGIKNINNAFEKVSDVSTKVASKIGDIVTALSKIYTVTTNISKISQALNNIPSGVKPLSVRFDYTTKKASAKGNVALAKGNEQPALAKGIPTLMGELGPELVVSQGHYFVVGQTGAEFVDLDKDAIVFNHKQTKRLLQNGSINSRGVPFTNETNALSFAKGGLFGPVRALTKDLPKINKPTTLSEADNPSEQGKTAKQIKNSAQSITELIDAVKTVPTNATLPLISRAKGTISGPAKASASAVLAQLKQIRAMWQSMLNASAQELGSLAGMGGGRGGGGGGGSDDNWQQKTTTAEIQRWYNLIRQIAKLEQDITYQETLQSKIQSDRVARGEALYNSYKKEYDLLQQEVVKNQELAMLQKSWYDNRRAELAASEYGKIFTYDENGLQQYTGTGAPGSGLGLDILENLTRRDVYGKAIDNAETAQKQLEYLQSQNFDIEKLKYNNDGTTIDLTDLEDEELDNAYVQMMENFWSNVDGWRDELDSIYDSYHDQLENVLENQAKQNEIVQKIVDNQLSVEQDVLKAIESREQKRIDDAQDERDALADAAEKFLNGLSKQLSDERKMYERQNDQNELDKLRRQLAILTRSGGSSSQIRNLQEQIDARAQEAYFTAQQDQIDAIKEASDAQIERLDQQIDIMTETLEYQKENGLLWQEVYQVMAGTPEQILDFIMNYTPDFQSDSALQVKENVRDLNSKIGQWIAYRNDSRDIVDESEHKEFDAYNQAMVNTYGENWAPDMDAAQQAFEQTLEKTGDSNLAAQTAMQLANGQRNIGQQATQPEIIHEPQPVQPSEPEIEREQTNANNSSYWGEGTLAANYKYYTSDTPNGGDQSPVLHGPASYKIVEISGNQAKLAEVYENGRRAEEFDGRWTTFRLDDPKKNKRFTYKQYKEGGLVDYTGFAQVDGTPDRPESFFDAAHTKLLKEDMAMREQLLPSLLSTYNNMIQNTSSRDILNNTNSNDSVNIERLELNFQVDKLSNDYDTRRAVDAMMDELMNISRKSGNTGINRR